jgi:hypothetical protein
MAENNPRENRGFRDIEWFHIFGEKKRPILDPEFSCLFFRKKMNDDLEYWPSAVAVIACLHLTTVPDDAEDEEPRSRRAPEPKFWNLGGGAGLSWIEPGNSYLFGEGAEISERVRVIKMQIEDEDINRENETSQNMNCLVKMKDTWNERLHTSAHKK